MAYVLKATQIEKEAQILKSCMQSQPQNKNIRLDVLSGDGANLVEGNVVLPKDIFNSYLSYSLYVLRGGS
ncbi:BAQ_1a_G0000760.mRNA.1.CDS.1 [Saccharomyces cerevisiae]|nr:BAQ_1a_G0000760.mRNA.1.CDS.1 [Saccharomyces cerevisiae]CAI7035832.1 BAQ_1a_G0000760.mRNA.1.CDS.1 [Saccharomyces cerevisiae]